MRIQKLLSQRGVASRRKAEEMISAGRVTVNGIVAALGDSADPNMDTVLVDGVLIPPEQQLVYIMLHKPRGYVTTMADDRGRKTVADLVSQCPVRVFPVGRLDYDSEGLLLMTNDGEAADRFMHPKHEINKVYRVTVSGYSEEALSLLKRPIELDGYKIRTPGVRMISSGKKAELEVTIHEGRNRQVRRMCDAAGMKVLRLKRVSEGTLRLGSLSCGQWRYLTDEEIASLIHE